MLIIEIAVGVFLGNLLWLGATHYVTWYCERFDVTPVKAILKITGGWIGLLLIFGVFGYFAIWFFQNVVARK